jgi:hypothetical protein
MSDLSKAAETSRQPPAADPLWLKCLHYVPQTLFALVGFAYATGFLTVFTFLERFGVRDAGADFFKIKYIHVGILALFFPIGIVVPMLAIFSFWRAAKDRGESRKDAISVHLSNAILMTNMIFGFYVLVLFAEPEFFQKREWVLPSVFGFTLLGLWLINKINKILPKEWFHQSAKWILTAGAVSMQVWWWKGMSRNLALIFWGTAGENLRPLWVIRHWPWLATARDWAATHSFTAVDVELARLIRHHPPKGGVYYVLFIFLCVYLAVRTYVFSRSIPNSEKPKVYVAGAVLISTTYFLSVLAFAYRIYPYIPVAKGGGDYTHASRVILQPNPENIWNLPDALFEDPATRTRPSRLLVLIEQTPDAVYVARIDDEDGPRVWRGMERLPTVMEVSRDELLSVIHFSNKPSGAQRISAKPTVAP